MSPREAEEVGRRLLDAIGGAPTVSVTVVEACDGPYLVTSGTGEGPDASFAYPADDVERWFVTGGDYAEFCSAVDAAEDDFVAEAALDAGLRIYTAGSVTPIPTEDERRLFAACAAVKKAGIEVPDLRLVSSGIEIARRTICRSPDQAIEHIVRSYARESLQVEDPDEWRVPLSGLCAFVMALCAEGFV